MGWGGPDFIIAIVAGCTVGRLVNNWIRARHGFAVEDEWGGKTERPDSQATADQKRENALLKARRDALENRAAAIETIITDKGYDVTRQIEALRSPREIVAGRANTPK